MMWDSSKNEEKINLEAIKRMRADMEKRAKLLPVERGYLLTSEQYAYLKELEDCELK